MSFLPKSRTQEYQNNNDGTRTIRCYNQTNPHYYKDGDGNYNAIDLSYTSSLNNSNVGNYTLKSKNIHSLGIRQDDNKEKYIGIRPDDTQDGSQQFEWTIISASVNGNDVPIDLSKNEFVNNIQTNLGNVTLLSTRRYTRQMLHYTGSINDFKLEYKIDLTGLKVSGSKYTSSTTLSNSNNVSVDTNYYKENDGNEFVILDNDDNVKYKITEPVLLDSDFNVVETSGSVHTLKDNGDNTYNYTKYPASSSINNISGSVNYIDATTVYGNPFDGTYQAGSFFASWNTAHDSATGTSQQEGYTSAKVGIITFDIISRFVESFDTSGITDTVSATTLNLFIKTITNSPSFIALSGSHDTTSYATSNYAPALNDGSSLSGWGTSDVTAFSAEATPTATEEYLVVDLNAAAFTGIQNADTFKIMLMDHDNDYSDVDGTPNNTMHIYTMEDDTNPFAQAKDPYISVTIGEAAATVVLTTSKVLSGNLTLKGGQLIIK